MAPKRCPGDKVLEADLVPHDTSLSISSPLRYMNSSSVVIPGVFVSTMFLQPSFIGARGMAGMTGGEIVIGHDMSPLTLYAQ